MLNRRNFLQATAFVGTVVAAKGVVQTFIPELNAVDTNNPAFDKVDITNGDFSAYPPFEKWDSWKELDGDDWKRGGINRNDIKVRDYMIVPTACSNCEAACGITGWVDKKTLEVVKYMGNPLHSGSRGRNCAKGYAMTSQMYDPDRIPFPLKRAPGSKRGEGKWIRVSWDEALKTIGTKMHDALASDDGFSKKNVMFHVGRPNENGFTPRVWHTLGVDCTNSHTNICSSGGRTGTIQWANDDRSSPDWENAKLIFLVSSHAADAGHYFQQAAGLIADARANGAKMVVMDPRMSNSAGIADLWIAPWPGTEGAIFLTLTNLLLQDDNINHSYVKTWFNWQELMDDKAHLNYLLANKRITTLPKGDTYEDFVLLLKDMYKDYTVEWCSKETHVRECRINKLYNYVVDAGDRVAQYFWRGPAAGNRGGWVAAGKTGFMYLGLLGALNNFGGSGFHHGHVISVAGKGHDATVGGKPEAVTEWNEYSWPPEWPLSTYELSFLLPHLLADDDWRNKWNKRGLNIPDRLKVWVPRMYNPAWINPDGFRWLETIRNEEKMEMTFNLAPTWSETNWHCDFVLPVGLAGERHDQHSEATKPERWTSFRQPVLRVAQEKMGWTPKNPNRATLEAHMRAGLGEIWEENEFWITLVHDYIDPDGKLGIQKYWSSKRNPGKPVTISEYYNDAFGTLPNLKKTAHERYPKADLPVYEYMRDHGTWTEETNIYHHEQHEIHEHHGEVKVKDDFFFGGSVKYKKSSVKFDKRNNQYYVIKADKTRHNIGLKIQDESTGKDKMVTGFATPSGKLEFYTSWLKDWKWEEYCVPFYPRNEEEKDKYVHIVSHVHHRYMKANNEFALNTVFRLPYNIHTRSANSAHLMEISQNHNPLWISTQDAKALGLKRGDAVKVKLVDTVAKDENGNDLESGYFIAMAVPTEGILPGTLANSHHAGRWRLVNEINIPGFEQKLGMMSFGSEKAKITEEGNVRKLTVTEGRYDKRIHNLKAAGEFKNENNENGWPYVNYNSKLRHIQWETDSGVWQNAVAASTPDPISGMHCWHKKAVLEKVQPGEKVGDVYVNIDNNMKIYQAWRDELARPLDHTDKIRRPMHIKRPWVKLSKEAYQVNIKKDV
jgi:anaerobic selenocysteine-containing dehydrogenase